jgi:hypothetical protein
MASLAAPVNGYSNSRILTVSAPVPVPIGPNPCSPTLLTWPFKDPADILDYKIDLGPTLIGVSGDYIETADVEIAPSQAGDLLLENITVDGFVLIVWLSGGNDGVTYTITFNVGTLSRKTLGGSIFLPVIALSELSSPTDSITTETGVLLMDENGNPIAQF